MTNKEEFISLLRSTNRKGIEDLIAYLETTDFYDAPASTRYHNSKPMGLLKHSLNVYRALKEINGIEKYQEDTIILVSLLHDICKIGFYTMSMRNVKKGNAWVCEPYYTVDDKTPLGISAIALSSVITSPVPTVCSAIATKAIIIANINATMTICRVNSALRLLLRLFFATC